MPHLPALFVLCASESQCNILMCCAWCLIIVGSEPGCCLFGPGVVVHTLFVAARAVFLSCSCVIVLDNTWFRHWVLPLRPRFIGTSRSPAWSCCLHLVCGSPCRVCCASACSQLVQIPGAASSAPVCRSLEVPHRLAGSSSLFCYIW